MMTRIKPHLTMQKMLCVLMPAVKQQAILLMQVLLRHAHLGLHSILMLAHMEGAQGLHGPGLVSLQYTICKSTQGQPMMRATHDERANLARGTAGTYTIQAVNDLWTIVAIANLTWTIYAKLLIPSLCDKTATHALGGPAGQHMQSRCIRKMLLWL